MNQLINDPAKAVAEMARGILLAHPHLQQLGTYPTIVTREDRTERVSLASGGGSGHEPAHWGYVGPGMLDAACGGDVFTSPSAEQVHEAIRFLDGRNGHVGVLLIVKNFAGDVMNFGIAADTARNEGVSVATVVVNDDVSIPDPANRRGIAGAPLVHKVAGAMALRSAPLGEVRRVAEKAVENLASFGVATTACTLPGARRPSFALADGEMELGIGIHGERGIATAPLKDATGICEIVAEKLQASLPPLGKRRVLLLINGMGGTPTLELYLVFGLMHRMVSKMGAEIAIGLAGNYMTSLGMAGFSGTILVLDRELEELLRAQHGAPAFPDLSGT
jgi:dihydroxyacetone kinase-like protein